MICCTLACDTLRRHKACFTPQEVTLTPTFVPQAEEITLTIGQAFDLAYRQFLDSSGKDLENRKQMMLVQKRLAVSQAEADELRRRLKAVSELAPPAAVQEYCRQNLVSSFAHILTGWHQPSCSSWCALLLLFYKKNGARLTRIFLFLV